MSMAGQGGTVVQKVKPQGGARRQLEMKGREAKQSKAKRMESRDKEGQGQEAKI
jgi:hypothetical protein